MPAAAPVAKTEPAENSGSVSSTIASLRRLSDGRHQATLANGEIWTQTEADARTEMRIGEAITIRPASFGSFQMELASGLRTRVKRTK
jgi:hypothetical protein